jgi:hypothetical protein
MTELDLLGYRPISGGAIDTTQVPTDEQPAGAPDAGADTVAGTAADTGTTDQGYDIGGTRYTAEQLAEALKSHSNRSDWQRTLKQQEMGMADVAKAVQFITGKQLHELAQEDFDDLTSIGVLNRRLRGDEGFRKRWFETFNRLADSLETQGVPRLEAERQAATRIARAQEAGKSPSDVKTAPGTQPQVDPRVDRLERWASRQEYTSLQNYVGDSVAAALEQIGKGIEPWHEHLGDLIIGRIQLVDDADLVRMMYDGRLAGWVNQLSEWYVKRFNTTREAERTASMTVEQKAALETARALAANKGKVPPVPLRGTAPGAVSPTLPEPVRGAGMRHLHQRADQAVTGT